MPASADDQVVDAVRGDEQGLLDISWYSALDPMIAYLHCTPQARLDGTRKITMAAGAHLWGAEYCVTQCDLGIFVDQAAEPVAAPNAHTGHFRRRMRTPGGRVLLQCPVRPMAVVMIGVRAEDQPQVPFVGDQHAVQALAAALAIHLSAIALNDTVNCT